MIESKTFNSESRDNKDGNSEIVRIPISEERIETVKRTVKLEDVSVYKRKYEEIQHIEESLKKEKVNIETLGDAAVTEKD